MADVIVISEVEEMLRKLRDTLANDTSVLAKEQTLINGIQQILNQMGVNLDLIAKEATVNTSVQQILGQLEANMLLIAKERTLSDASSKIGLNTHTNIEESVWGGVRECLMRLAEIAEALEQLQETINTKSSQESVDALQDKMDTNYTRLHACGIHIQELEKNIPHTILNVTGSGVLYNLYMPLNRCLFNSAGEQHGDAYIKVKLTVDNEVLINSFYEFNENIRKKNKGEINSIEKMGFDNYSTVYLPASDKYISSSGEECQAPIIYDNMWTETRSYRIDRYSEGTMKSTHFTQWKQDAPNIRFSNYPNFSSELRRGVQIRTDKPLKFNKSLKVEVEITQYTNTDYGAYIIVEYGVEM